MKKPNMPLRARRLALLAMALFLLASCATTPNRGSDRSSILAKASRSDYNGIPLIKLRGSPYEVGFQYGTLMARELGQVEDEFMSVLDSVIGTGIKRHLAESVLESKARQTVALLPAEFEEELKGIADGSGQSYRDILILAMTPEALFDVNCSSVVTRGDRIVHARNFDFYFPGNIVSKYPLVARYEIEGRLPFVNAGFVGLFGCYTGANDSGLCITEDTALFARKSKAATIPVGYAVRMALEGASSLAEVRSLYADIPTAGYIVTVSSLTERDASVFDLAVDGCVETRMAGSSIRVANRYLADGNRRDNESLLADFDANTAREDALDRALSRPFEDPVRAARDILADRSFALVSDLPPLQSLLQDATRTVDNYSSIQSAIFDPANRVLHVSWREGYSASAPFTKINLDDLSASPSFPGDGLLESEAYRQTRAFVSRMHHELLLKGFTFTLDDYRRLYPEVLSADLPELAKNDWVLSFALRLGDWPRAEACAANLSRLMPGSYYGPFWQGFTALKQGRAAEAVDRFHEAASTPGLSACADFVISVYLADAWEALGDKVACDASTARAKAILARYSFTDGLAKGFGTYFADPSLKAKVEGLLAAVERERK